jgi:hypothetical protein
MAAAPKAGRLDPLKKAAAALSARIPFLPKRQPVSREPFSAIEDDTPLGDLLSSDNAAPGMAPRAPGREKPDVRSLVTGALKSPPILIGTLVVLAFLLTLAVTALLVAAPPRASAAPPPFTEKGQALVKTWLVPPGDPFENRMSMEREGRVVYTAEDAARIGLKPDPAMEAALRDKNDEAIEDLYGTVP